MPETKEQPFTEKEVAEIMKQYKDLDLKWYQSTRGPQLSATITGFSGLVLTLLKLVFNIEIGPDVVNLLITAAMILGFGVWTLWGYFKSRKHLMGQIAVARQLGSIGRQG